MYSEDNKNWKEKLYTIIFESETPAGKMFDILLIIAILLSVIVVMADSVEEIRINYGTFFYFLEWLFTLLFTAEYILRTISVSSPRKYIFSFFGIIDFLAILPTYLSLFVPGTQFLLLIRSFRLLRLFRVLKMVRYIEGSSLILRALKASAPKIVVFLLTVFSVTVIAGAVMYIVEGPENGFSNIPESMYWAIVTISTVGYGDISPQTPLGKVISSIMMIFAYGILAVPTGIVTYELTQSTTKEETTNAECKVCGFKNNDTDAKYCKKCGGKI